MKSRVWRSLTIALAFAVLGSSTAGAQATPASAAQVSVESWLSLIDTQRYGESWDAAAALFRRAIPREKWEAAVGTAREPLGELKSRKVQSATATKTLPGAPDGEYVVFQFATVFERKAAAVETVTAIREGDGTWTVGGYFIK
jgi:hypothetical protein